MLKLTIFSLLLLTVVYGLDLTDKKIIYQSTVYGDYSDEYLTTPRKVFDQKNLLSTVTVFDDGTIITVGDENEAYNPKKLLSYSDDFKRVVYAYFVTDDILRTFVEKITTSGFLDLPYHDKSTNPVGVICDVFKQYETEHQICYTPESSHPVLELIENSIRELFDYSYDFKPSSIYVEVNTLSTACNNNEYLEYDEVTAKYGSDWSDSRYYHGDNVQPFWDAANNYLCTTVNGNTYAFTVTTKHISPYFLNYYDNGYDISQITDGSTVDYYTDYDNSFSPVAVWIIIGTSVLCFIMVIIAVVRSAKRRRANANVHVVDPTASSPNFTVTAQPTEYYVQQTNAGPVYYATVNPGAPTQGIYYTNQ